MRGSIKKINLLIFGIILVITLSYCLIGLITYVRTHALTGRERSARIDISSENMKFDFIGVNSNGIVIFFNWLPKKEDQKKGWMAQMGLRNNKWQELWVEFTPTDSGFVLINIRGFYYLDLKINHHRVWVDGVKVEGEGATIQNGSFENVDSKGNPVDWGWSEPSKNRYSTDGTQAHTGKACILVWYDYPVAQRIAVKAMRQYRVSAWFKPYYAEVTPVEEEIF